MSADATAAAADAPQPQITPKGYLQLVGLGAAIGIPAAALAALFLAVVHWLEDWLWETLPHHIGNASSAPQWYLVIFLPVIGAAIVLVVRRLLPGDGGHSPLVGIGGGAVPLRNAPGIALAALGTLAFGAVLGPEAPLIALGSVVGVVAARAVGSGERESSVLGSAGSFSAISSLFGGPIVGGILMLEGSIGLGLGAGLLPVLIPGFVAAATGYVLFVGLGDWGGLPSQTISIPDLPAYNGTHITDLLLAIAVGIVAAIVINLVREMAKRINTHGPPRIGKDKLLIAGGLAVGLLAQTASWLGANSQDVLFSGQSGLPDLIAQTSTGIVIVLLITKGLAYGICLSCGFRGGPIFPAIFLGVTIATLLIIWFGVSPTLAVAIGTGAGMAATSKLILTPIVFAELLVGQVGADAVPSAVLATIAAWLTVTALERRLGPTSK
jgi:H+/Cl- antiporter ClcA